MSAQWTRAAWIAVVAAVGSVTCAGVALFAIAVLRGDSTLQGNGLPVQPIALVGVGLVLAQGVWERVSKRHPADDPSYAGYAFVECPECWRVVPMSRMHCPLCGAELFAPWSNTIREA